MTVRTELLYKYIADIRFADLICTYQNLPHSVKITTCIKPSKSAIELHVPARCKEIISSINNEDRILLKYSTEYAEASSEWCLDAEKDKRISTIIGLEIHIRSKLNILTTEEMICHLKDTADQSKVRIGDQFKIDQLDQKYLSETLTHTVGYRLNLSNAEIKTVENFIHYRTDCDKAETIKNLRRLEKSYHKNKFSVAADMLEDALEK